MMHLRPLTKQDDISASILLDGAFGGPDMYHFAQALREDGTVAMERVAEEDGKILGYVCCAKMVEPENWWSLAILAVSPNHHKRGMGREIIARAMNHARREGAHAVVVVGDPNYFSKVGFSTLAASNLQSSFVKGHTLVYPITPGTGLLEGTLEFPEAYAHLTGAEAS